MRKKAETATCLAIVVISALTAAYARPPIVLNEAGEWARATVTGHVDGLREFDKNVNDAIGGAEKLEGKLIRCVGCDKLYPTERLDQPAELMYYLSREHLPLFGRAWSAAQSKIGQKAFSLEIDAVIPEPDCPVKTGCQALPTCSDGCGKKGPPANCGFC